MNASSLNPTLDYYTFDEGSVTKGELPPSSFLKAVEAGMVVALCISAASTNLITIASIVSIPRSNHVLDFYILSLSVANLLVAMAVIPFSLASKSKIFGYSSYVLCGLSGYLHVSLSAVYMYTFMWISVDRYLAVLKGLRYETIQTRTRCKCWILFTWVMATFLCSPPLLGDSRRHFYDDSFMCLLNANSMLPYTITLACLVLMPSIPTLSYTYVCIFTTPATQATKDDVGHNNSDHISTFIITSIFVLLWLPWGLLSIVEFSSDKILSGPTLRFWLLFLGQLHTIWTPLVLWSTCGRCRLGLRAMCRLCFKTGTSVPV
ncbi:hypothetical protein JTE90_007883 [Oedothorax gibbosus]|uniref:G-protein coupled receptors family 1 profile domain-containing protein n=1 Tax=Oedothorax gibbosus TaxID=931172 RepID=A0AAV6VKR3_9ARAC|nr:hypothetical protein JTE90_007883 [Oedothorax gibbosus]